MYLKSYVDRWLIWLVGEEVGLIAFRDLDGILHPLQDMRDELNLRMTKIVFLSQKP